MRLVPDIGFGTHRFPPMVARRLRALNVACWSASLIWLGFGIGYYLDQGVTTIVIVDFALAVICAAIPLLHRFGPRAAPYVFITASFAAVFYICLLLGTDSGMQVQFLAYAAGTPLVMGSERWRTSMLVAVVAIVLIIVLEVVAPRDGGLVNETVMFAGFIACVTGTGTVLVIVVFYAVREATRAEAKAEFEFERSESLLVNVLPAAIASRLKGTARPLIADRYDDASILFADMVGFTERTGAMAPAVVVGFLNEVFAAFDHLVEKHGLEKIKTTGDNYMVVSGVPVARADHAIALAAFALDMLDVASRIFDPNRQAMEMRIGLASGPVVAGVVGARKFFYDVWGDAVNVASRMESTGIAGRIQVSQAIHAQLKDRFRFEARGVIEVKGKGPMPTWFLTGPVERESQAGSAL